MTGAEPQEETPQTPGFVAQLTAYSNIIAPASVITALLFYFGYLATRARFEYFGVYLDLVNLSTPDLLLYGSDVVFVPITLVAFTVLVAFSLRLAGQWLVSEPRRDTLSGWITLTVLLVAVLLLLKALVGILVPSVSREESPGVTPLSLTLGALLLRYSASLWQTLAARRPRPTWMPPREGINVGRYALLSLIVAGLFWAANSFAFVYGNGRALDDVDGLTKRPAVTLYSHDLVDDPPQGVVHTVLPGKEKFRHRYTGLRLLVESDKRLFLVPAPWSPDTSRTLVIENSSDIRLQLVPPTPG
ncbi:hypothetical protein [Streptosporangium sp. CA-115845]|uniref:hypothetical protein n=1 Tax=Streptosporangium sp. CA-115845 TaxID=3240071 RepID=UPI003D90AFE4